MKYVIDTSVFVEAKRRYYAFDVCPGFWSSLCWQQGEGSICSIDRVLKEIEDGADDLTTWAKTVMPVACFADSTTPDVATEYAAAMAYVANHPDFSLAAKAEFAVADRADAWLVAFAKAKGLTLVTHEVLVPGIKRKVPIPNVCQALGIPFMDTFDMLRALNTQFSWSAPG